MESPMKNMEYWKNKNKKSSATPWITLALGAAKGIMSGIAEHKNRKDALERKEAEANSKAVSNMPKFG